MAVVREAWVYRDGIRLRVVRLDRGRMLFGAEREQRRRQGRYDLRVTLLL